jgi:hypothetical protein
MNPSSPKAQHVGKSLFVPCKGSSGDRMQDPGCPILQVASSLKIADLQVESVVAGFHLKTWVVEDFVAMDAHQSNLNDSRNH